MSLATRCPSCGTVFRVVQDQLKVSEGWVRCGRCDEVFSALEGLFDLERDAAPPWPRPADDARFEPAAHAIEPALPPTTDGSDPALVERIDAELFGVAERDAAPIEPRYVAADEPAAEAALGHVEPRFDEPPVDPQPRGEAWLEPAHGAPEFVRHADRQARWQRPAMRRALVAASVVLLLLLALQWILHFRDTAAARWPALRPALAGWCSAWHCSLDAPRRIEDVSVENTTLTRASGPDAFRLTVTLRNRGALTVAMPSIDLSLTDNAGQLIARRALAPGDFRVASALLAPGSEAPLQLLLTAGTPRVTGYTVEIFYP
ncbi:MAG: zinc-ribbon domain-containing protein [Proteobacteria bacterium]|nr:zinc-ribbon domain-containing protein [Pseudomonadota bacterium]